MIDNGTMNCNKNLYQCLLWPCQFNYKGQGHLQEKKKNVQNATKKF